MLLGTDTKVGLKNNNFFVHMNESYDVSRPSLHLDRVRFLADFIDTRLDGRALAERDLDGDRELVAIELLQQ